MNIKEEIKKKINNGFFLSNDFKIIKLESDEVILEYDVKESGLNSYNIVHGGILFSLCDYSSGLLSVMNNKMPVTTNASINFLNVARCKKLKCIAHTLRQGKTIGYYEAKIYDEHDELLTVGSVNMFLRELEQ